MNKEVVFNDLPTDLPSGSIGEARKAITECIEGFSELIASYGFKSYIRCASPLFDAYITDDYGFLDWCRDKENPRDLRTLLQKTVLKCPADSGASIDMILSIDCSIEGEPKSCLKAAWLTGSILLSLNYSPWNNSTIEAQLDQLDEAGSITSQTVSFLNVFSKASAESHHSAFQPDLSSLTRQDYWERRAEFFPNLIFSRATEKFFNSTSDGGRWPLILSLLKLLNKAANEWTSGYFDVTNYFPSATPESQSTMQNPTLAAYRSFLFEDKKRTCEWHIKTADGWRIHYLAEAFGTIHVGHIGPHLPL